MRRRYYLSFASYHCAKLDVVGVVVSGRMNDAMKQGCWPLALAVGVMPGKDDVIRVVKVRTKDGEYMRPFAKLYKLQENTLTTVMGRLR